jgi:hypothetical protein
MTFLQLVKHLMVMVSNIDSAKFYLRKVNSPTGNANAKLYAVTGTPGTNGYTDWKRISCIR